MSDIVADLRGHAATYATKAKTIAQKRDALSPLVDLAQAEKDIVRQIGELQTRLDEVRQQAVDRAALDYQHRGYIDAEHALLTLAEGHAKAPRPAAEIITDARHSTGRAVDAEALYAPPPGVPAAAPPGDQAVANSPLETRVDPPGRRPFRGPQDVVAGPRQQDPATLPPHPIEALKALSEPKSDDQDGDA